MQAIDLNLATRPFKNNTLLWVGFVLAVVLLAAVTTRNVEIYRKNRNLLADLTSDYDNVKGELNALDRREVAALREVGNFDRPRLTLRADKANEFIRWKAFSWTELFNRLQDIQPWDVQMSSIHPIFRPDTRQGDRREIKGMGVPVSVEGIAKNLEAFLEFERALFHDPHFNRVEPEGIDTSQNTKESVFRLRFFYDPDATPEPEPEAVVGKAPDGDPSADQPAVVPEGEGEQAPEGSPVIDVKAVVETEADA